MTTPEAMTTHTPTPWSKAIHAATVLGPAGEAIAALESRGSLGKADAAHIIRCVNAHDELVAALREWVALEECYGDKARIPARARAALAKVEPTGETKR